MDKYTTNKPQSQDELGSGSGSGSEGQGLFPKIYHIATALITLVAFLCQAAVAEVAWVEVEKLLQAGQLRPVAAGERNNDVNMTLKADIGLSGYQEKGYQGNQDIRIWGLGNAVNNMKDKILTLTSILLIITLSWQQLAWAYPDYTYEVFDGLRPRAAEYRRGTLKITNVGQVEDSILQMERENSYNLFDRMMRLMMAAPIHYAARNDSEEHQKPKYNIKKINSFHFYPSPLSIDSPTTNNVTNEMIPVITRLNRNPEVKGPTINVATQILLISKSVLPKFSRWRFVNFIKHKYISFNTFCQDCQRGVKK